MTDGGLTIIEGYQEQTMVISVGGRIDSGNAADFGQRLVAMFERGENRVLVDFANLLYLTSAGFRALLVAMDAAELRGATLRLCAMQPTVRELFEMGGLLDLFEIFASQREALTV